MQKVSDRLKSPAARMVILMLNMLHPGLSEAMRRLSWSSEKMRSYELSRLKAIVSHAYEHIPLYKKLYAAAGVTPADLVELGDIEKFPIMTKAMLREGIADGTVYAEPAIPKGSIPESTTGSTGNPLTLIIDAHSHHERTINAKRAMLLMGALPYKRYAFLWRKKSLTLGQRIRTKLGLFKLIPVTDVMRAGESALDADALGAIVNDLAVFRPQIIRGYTSAIWVIAKYAERHGIAIRPEAVISSAEYLPPLWQQELERIFQCRVYNLYGGTEAAPVAASIPDTGELTVFSDFYHIEVVNEDNERTAPGVAGRILVTDYANRYMPLIRYEIGDVAEWSSTIPKPFPFFKEVRGRINDIFILPGGKIVFSHNWHIYFRDLKSVTKFKVIQKAVDQIDVRLERATPDVQWNDELETAKQTVERALGNGVTLTWSLEDQIPLDPGDKFRATKSEVDIDTILKTI